MKRARNKIIHHFFSWYITRIVNRHFRRVNYNPVQYDSERALLLISNHFSWWDGFLLFYINKKYFRKKFHVMVNEENYRKIFFLKYLGAFPVKRNSREIIHALEYAGKLLDDPQNLVLIFPQGKLYSNHIDDVVFEKGLINLINSSVKRFQYIFAAIFIDYFDKPKATVTCHMKKWDGEEFISLQLVKNEYNKHYEASRLQQCSASI